VDTLARFLAERMRASLGQPLVIENISGAGRSICVGRVARASPGGCTLIIGITSTTSSMPREFQAMAGHDRADPASANLPIPD
jgi:tripartite-type tricarboxylate transporter receptor subunit TctC